jgi:hypothetical protein
MDGKDRRRWVSTVFRRFPVRLFPDLPDLPVLPVLLSRPLYTVKNTS